MKAKEWLIANGYALTYFPDIMTNTMDIFAASEVAETKRLLGLCELMKAASVDLLCAKDDELAAKDAEIAETKKIAGYWQSRWETANKVNDNESFSILGLVAENRELKAEKKRLRDGVDAVLKHKKNYNHKQSILSPADGDGKPNRRESK